MFDDFVIISFFELGIVWIAIPAFLVYPVARCLRKREWGNLFSVVDLVSCFVTHVIWFYVVAHDFHKRGVGRLADIFLSWVTIWSSGTPKNPVCLAASRMANANGKAFFCRTRYRCGCVDMDHQPCRMRRLNSGLL